MLMNETIELLRRRRSLPPRGMAGPGTERARNRRFADRRLPRARPWQADALGASWFSEGAARDRAGAIAGEDPGERTTPRSLNRADRPS